MVHAAEMTFSRSSFRASKKSVDDARVKCSEIKMAFSLGRALSFVCF
jgi:hypothetical protein